MEPDVKLHIEITISKGRGYIPAVENRPAEAEFGLIPIDSIYTPITNVKYTVENYRVEQKTDYEKLVLEISTDGSIQPKDALKEAAKILIYHFLLFSDEKITIDSDEKFANEEFDEEVLHMRQLKAADVDTLGELVQYNRTDLLKFRNFGKKSLTELDDLLLGMGLNFGMDIAKFKLDKD
jgi:DNA-directed RNA polymerase subunit alpha